MTIKFHDNDEKLWIPKNFKLKITTSPHGILEFQILSPSNNPLGGKMRVKDVDFITNNDAD